VTPGPAQATARHRWSVRRARPSGRTLRTLRTLRSRRPGRSPRAVGVPEIVAYWLQAGRIDVGFLGAALAVTEPSKPVELRALRTLVGWGGP
jgi:hypothetical protein